MSASDADLQPEGNDRAKSRDDKSKASRPKLRVFEGELEAPAASLIVRPDGSLVPIPTSAEMAEMLVVVQDPLKMKELHDMAVEWEASAERLNKAFEQMFAVAEFRIRLERRMGTHLAQTIRRGGHGSNQPRVGSKRGGCSAGLPKCITDQRASWYRKVARIPDEVFETYLATQRQVEKPPSSKGFVAFAATQARKGRPPGKVRRGRGNPTSQSASSSSRAHVDESIWIPVWDAISALVKVDLAIGVDAKLVRAAQGVDLAAVRPKHLKGHVLVRAHDRIDELLINLHEAKQKGQVIWAMLAFTATTSEPWFRLLDEHGWTCCFLRGAGDRGAIVAYLDEHPRPLALRLSRLGAVLRGSQAQHEGR